MSPNQIPVRYALQLSDEELCALGKITYFWSVMDNMLSTNMMFCAMRYNVDPGPAAKAASFRARRQAFKEMILRVGNDMPQRHRDRCLAIDGRITRAAAIRDKLTHGVAYRGHTNPATEIRMLRSLPPKHVDHNTSLQDMLAFADELSLIAGELTDTIELWCHNG